MLSVLILNINETHRNKAEAPGSCPLPEAGEDDPRLFLLGKGLRVLGTDSLADRLTAGMLRLNPDGKPSLPERTGVFFNLSHSGDYLAGAFSDSETGMDIQKISPPHSGVLRIAGRFFTPAEYELLAAAKKTDDRLELFFRLWSIKEAYIKYCGCGMRGGLDSFQIRPLPEILPIRDKKHDQDTHRELETETETEMDMAEDTHKDHNEGMGEEIQKNFQRGSLSVLKNELFLSPAEYALLSGPPGYSLAVCAEKIPDQIRILYL